MNTPARRLPAAQGDAPSRPGLVPGDGPLARALEAALPGRVTARVVDRLTYARDASPYRVVPRAVARPATVADVQALVAVARAERVPLTFRAAGTSLSGQAVGPGVVVDLARGWKGARALDGGARVVAEPGVIGGRLNALLRPLGRRIGPDPASLDACMLGGIVSNDASGMCCGTRDGSYRTLEAARVVLACGTALDLGDAGADERLRAARPDVHAGLAELRRRVLADADLAARIERKYRIKNTTGYGLRALVDFERPADALLRLLVGAEGTLAFLAELTLRTVPEPPDALTALLGFADLRAAAEAVDALDRAGARAVELLDHACLRAVAGLPGAPAWLPDLPPGGAALLCEWGLPGAGQAGAEDAAALARRIDAALAGLPVVAPIERAREPAARARLWAVRKGVFPAVGAARPAGHALVIEDVAVPRARLAEAALALERLLAAHGYDGPGVGVFGHARDGNLHFVFAPDLSGGERGEGVRRYAAFMEDLAALVVDRLDGSLKAEHGTGRNVAPFVAREWGSAGVAVMHDLKVLLDPGGVLNPGVLLSDDPRAHLRDLKPLPAVDPLVDRCIECGFCEPVCPSRTLTLSPRQRIAALRERAQAAAEAEGVGPGGPEEAVGGARTPKEGGEPAPEGRLGAAGERGTCTTAGTGTGTGTGTGRAPRTDPLGLPNGGVVPRYHGPAAPGPAGSAADRLAALDPADRLAALAEAWPVDGLDTCAADGLCARACPVGIDTGALVRQARARAASPAQARLAEAAVRHLARAEGLARAGLRAARALEALGGRALVALGVAAGLRAARHVGLAAGASPAAARGPAARGPAAGSATRRLPPPAPSLPSRSRRGADVVVWPSCTARVLGPAGGEGWAPASLVALLERAGRRPWVPRDAAGACCGLPFGSKGLVAARDLALARTVERAWAWTRGGRLPLVTDGGACALALRTAELPGETGRRARTLRVLDPATALRDLVLAPAPGRAPLPLAPTGERVAVHPSCSLRKLGAEGALLEVVRRSVGPDGAVVVPRALPCCGTAGDRGLLVPDLVAAATAEEAAELRAAGCARFVTDQPTCALGLTAATGLAFTDPIALVARALARGRQS